MLVVVLVVAHARARTVRARRVLSLLIVPAAVAWWVLGIGPLLIPLQLLAIVLVVQEWSPRVGALVIAIILGGVAVSYVALTGRTLAAALVESVGVAVLELFALVLAMLLRALRTANAQLRRTLDVEAELVLAEERARLSGELHDGLGHRLTLISMRLDLADRLADADPVAARTAVRESRASSSRPSTRCGAGCVPSTPRARPASPAGPRSMPSPTPSAPPACTCN